MNNQVDKFNKRYGYTSKIEENTLNQGESSPSIEDDKGYVEELKSKVKKYIEKAKNKIPLDADEKNDLSKIQEYLEQKKSTEGLDSSLEESFQDADKKIPELDEDILEHEPEAIVENSEEEKTPFFQKSKEYVTSRFNSLREKFSFDIPKINIQALVDKVSFDKESFDPFLEKIKGAADSIKNRAESDEEFQAEEQQQEIIKNRIANFNKRIEDVTSKKSVESKDTLTILQERVRILEKRSHTLKNRIANYKERKDSLGKQLLSRSSRNFKTLGDWYEESGGTKKLSSRVLVSVGISGLMGVFGFGTGLASVVGGVPGAYFGQGIGRGFYDKFIRKDFRSDLIKLRKEGLQNPESITSEEEKDNILQHRKNTYLHRLDNINDASLAKNIRSSERFKKISGVLGGMLFSGITRETGADILRSIGISDANILEHIAPFTNVDQVNQIEHLEIEKDVPELKEEIVQLEEHTPSYKDIKIGEGEGITDAFKRQIENSPELKEYFNLGENPTQRELINASAKAATETGYISDTQEVRVYLDKNAGYELSIKDGKLVSQEYEGITEKDGIYTGEKKELHISGEEFEGEDIEKHREYLTNKGAFQTIYDTPETDINLKEEYISEPIVETRIDLEEVFPESTLKEEILLSDEKLSLPENYFQKTVRSLDSLPGYKNIGGSIIGKSLGPKFENLLVPEYIITLFENTQYPENFMQMNDQLMELMGLEINKEPFKSASETFRIKGTDKLVGWKYIYEHVDLEQLKKSLTEAQR